ncbi:gamma-tubulin complex component 4-like [Sycon ciliatum]|uniref:gamma-tubulin complex component 4-like n=1 Tax=Sycon ciliatum TaxID=27933 RepID=UPI0031F6D7DF
MLRELLLALGGHPGAVFVQVNGVELEVAQDLSWITSSERDFLNRLCRLGTLYMRFYRIVEEQDDIPTASNGHYWRALCDGLRQILTDYLKDLVALEDEIVENGQVALTHIVRTVEPYQTLFTTLGLLFDDLKNKKMHGCQILDVLHQHSNHGHPSSQAAVRSLQYHCHQVFFRQLSSWLLHGLLVDRHSEFFIQPTGSTSAAETSAATDSVDGASISTTTMKAIKQQTVRLKRHSRRQRKARVLHGVASKFLPSYMPMQLANKILFVGEAVQMLATDDEMGVKRSSELYRGGSIFEEKEIVFARQLLTVQHLPLFNLIAMEEVVMDIYSCISARLWHYVMKEANLVEHLRVFKNHFLLGRGELFCSFLTLAEQILRSPPNNNTEHDVNIAFQQAVGELGSTDDETGFSFRVHVALPDKSSAQDKSSGSVAVQSGPLTGWQSIGLSCAVTWPLHLIFTDTAFEDYNKLFLFLLGVKRAAQFLHGSWINLMETAQSLRAMTADQRLLWKLRAEMAFFVDNLQYYLQVDVLTVQYRQLIERIENEQSFEAIHLAHDSFLASLTAQCFLNSKPASHCLKEILRMAGILYDLLQRLETWSDGDHKRLMDLQKMFARQSGLLLKILSSVGNHRSNPHLAQLLLRSDFNYFYSKRSATAF